MCLLSPYLREKRQMIVCGFEMPDVSYRAWWAMPSRQQMIPLLPDSWRLSCQGFFGEGENGSWTCAHEVGLDAR